MGIWLNELKIESMENNENKEVINLTDEELKEVTGGVQCVSYGVECYRHKQPLRCKKDEAFCIWENGQCVKKTSNS